MPSKPGKKANVPVVYWDSCVFIDWIEKNKPDRLVDISKLVSMAQNGELQIITSVLTEGEVIKWPEIGISDEEANRKIVDFFRNPWIIRRAVDTRVMGIVRKIRLAHKLKLPDAVHVATALIHEVVSLHTYDGNDLLKRDGLVTIDGKRYLKIADSTGLQVLRCRVSGRRLSRHPFCYHTRGCRDGRATEHPACRS